MRQALAAFVVLLALGWGGWQTKLGSDEATLAAVDRGLPNSDTMDALVEQLRSEVPPGEAVMSNLGPNLAWAARRPVVHLALTPADIDACRRRLDFHHVLVVFRDASKAWPGWTELVAHPGLAPNHPEWNIRQVREYRTDDGFVAIWLELGPLAPQLASAAITPQR